MFWDDYHRYNGDQEYDNYIQDSRGRTKKYNTVTRKVTESFVGHINSVTNMYVSAQVSDDGTNVIAFVSPMVDDNSFKGFTEVAISLVTINMFPVALCLGFPLMLFVQVMEKEEKIMELLIINGLETKQYWKAFYVYNFIQLTTVLLVFILSAKIFVDIEYFQKSSMLIFFWFLSIWNLAQISFALLVSTFVAKSSTATLVGYTVSIFLCLFISMISQFIFPSPGRLPWIMYFIPQTPYIRFFYLGISKCVEDNCIRNFTSIFGDEEVLFMFIMMHVNAFMYFVLGLMFNEPTLVKKLGLKKVIDFFTKDKISADV
jgi:hypothetical protein